MPIKIVVVGAVNGKFREVFTKLAALHAKNNFSLAIIAGNFFAEPADATEDDVKAVEELLSGHVTVPLPAYFTLGSNALPDNVVARINESAGEVCENLYFLSKRSTMKTSEGVRIVSLGGILDPSLSVAASKDASMMPFYSVGDARTLHGAQRADILLTAEWPVDIQVGSKAQLPDPVPTQQMCVTDLCTILKPRYFFSTSPSFYEREPFFHTPEAKEDAEPGYSTTRFISLAPYANPLKQKWIYAFTLDLDAPLPLTVPSGVTASPFAFISKKRALPTSAEQETFSRFASGNTHSHHDHHRGKRSRKHQKQPPPGPDQCFFCLSNPQTATHLITSIGEEAYMTTAKGPLSTAAAFPSLNCPAHMLIIPLSHSPTLASIPDLESRTATLTEMHRFRTAANDMLTANAQGSLGSVAWEVSRATGIHIHWQWLPVDAELLRKGLVETAFRVQAENEKYPPLTEGEPTPETDRFTVWLWTPPAMTAAGDVLTKEKEKVLSLALDPSFRFDLQYGRIVMAKLLGLDERVDWRACGQTEAEESRDAETFKGLFKKFDFTL